MSTLDQELEDYLSLRRAMGFKLARAEKLLNQFLVYMAGCHANVVTTDLALAWATTPTDASPRWWDHRLGAVRGFASYLQTLDPRVEVPPPGLIRNGPARATPYIYSAPEIAALLRAAGSLKNPLRAATLQALVGVLAVSGMRIGEAIDLDRADFDPATGILLVRNAKFGKSRQLPLHPSSVLALNTYLRQRDDLLPASPSAALFVSTRGTRLRYNDVWRTFSALTGQVGLLARSSSCRPRIHDLRHSFAVGTILDAYAQNADVQALLPVLSTYLGHADPKHTYWYLSAAPELLALAARRLDTHLGRLS